MDETAALSTDATESRLPVTRYVALLARHAMSETLGFLRRASSDSLLGSIALWMTPVGVLGYYIYKAHGPNAFLEWIVATGITAVTLVACLLVLFLIALLKSPLVIYRQLQQDNSDAVAELTERLIDAESVHQQLLTAKELAWTQRLNEAESRASTNDFTLRKELAELRDRETTPDVMLELDAVRSHERSHELFGITASNTGRDTATQIAIDPINSGEAPHGYNVDGEMRISPILDSMSIGFPIIPQLHSGKSATTTPTVDAIVSPALKHAVLALGHRLGLWSFLDTACDHRSYAAGQGGAGDLEDLVVEPLVVSLRLSFWNREQTRQWERTELLNYDPVTRRAHITHVGGPREVSAHLNER